MLPPPVSLHSRLAVISISALKSPLYPFSFLLPDCSELGKIQTPGPPSFIASRLSPIPIADRGAHLDDRHVLYLLVGQ